MANYEDRAGLKALADVTIFHFLIGKTTLNGVLNWVKKAVFFLFKTIQRKGEKIAPKKGKDKFEDLCGDLRQDSAPGQGNVCEGRLREGEAGSPPASGEGRAYSGRVTAGWVPPGRCRQLRDELRVCAVRHSSCRSDVYKQTTALRS